VDDILYALSYLVNVLAVAPAEIQIDPPGLLCGVINDGKPAKSTALFHCMIHISKFLGPRELKEKQIEKLCHEDFVPCFNIGPW
jgi:hypothetical protein